MSKRGYTRRTPPTHPQAFCHLAVLVVPGRKHTLTSSGIDEMVEADDPRVTVRIDPAGRHWTLGVVLCELKIGDLVVVKGLGTLGTGVLEQDIIILRADLQYVRSISSRFRGGGVCTYDVQSVVASVVVNLDRGQTENTVIVRDARSWCTPLLGGSEGTLRCQRGSYQGSPCEV